MVTSASDVPVEIPLPARVGGIWRWGRGVQALVATNVETPWKQHQLNALAGAASLRVSNRTVCVRTTDGDVACSADGHPALAAAPENPDLDDLCELVWYTETRPATDSSEYPEYPDALCGIDAGDAARAGDRVPGDVVCFRGEHVSHGAPIGDVAPRAVKVRGTGYVETGLSDVVELRGTADFLCGLRTTVSTFVLKFWARLRRRSRRPECSTMQASPPLPSLRATPNPHPSTSIQRCSP